MSIPKSVTQQAFTLNNKKITIENTAPTTTLLNFLRQNAFVGTKEGCAEGDCGACTVAVLSKNAEAKACYKAVNSCLVPIANIVDKEVVSVEGIGTVEDLHPVQQAMVDLAGSQCGYCTPGFVMSMFASYYDSSDASAEKVFEGNLCRCTGYVPIRKALQGLDAPQQSDVFAKKLEEASFEESALHFEYENISYFQPISLTDTFELLEQHPEARFLAGGTDLVLEIYLGHYQPKTLISLEAVSELQELSIEDSQISIGAGVVLNHVESELKGHFPAIDEMLHWFASTQIRNRATLGGNIATASPIGDMPIALLALDASLVLASKTGERTIKLSDFFLDYRKTALAANEIIKTIIISKTTNLNQSYKVGKRGTDDISIVSAAYSIAIENDLISEARLAYGGVAAIPARAKDVEDYLIGKAWNEDTVATAKTMLFDSFTPLSDHRASADYRKKLVGNLFEKFFWEMQDETKRGMQS